MVKLGSWNMKGLNSPIKQKEIKVWLNRNRIIVARILQTQVKKERP